ncbi:MAG: NAD-glutamate dehydrogenase [bacterium]|nr:NAD-glutamate dehydrogenase [bacterium]
MPSGRLPGTDVRVRRARRQDLPRLAPLLAGDAAGRDRRFFRRLLADLGADVYVAEDAAGALVGVVAVAYVRSLAAGRTAALLDAACLRPGVDEAVLDGLLAVAATRARRRGCPRCARSTSAASRLCTPRCARLGRRAGGGAGDRAGLMGAEVRTQEGRPGGSAERLQPLLARRAAGPEAVQLATFARLLLARAGGALDALPAEAVAGMVTSAFRFFAGPGPGGRVRALSPTLADDGWDAPWSVLESAQPDRPFLVDTVVAALRAEGHTVLALLHPIVGARRDAVGRLEALGPPVRDEHRESFLHLAIPRVADPARLAHLADVVRARLADVRRVTDDFEAMQQRARDVAEALERLGAERAHRRATEASEAADFLRWLVAGAFVFLGYREYVVTDAHVAVAPGSGLGLLRDERRSRFAAPQPRAMLEARLAGVELVRVDATATPAPVHRRAPMEDVSILVVDPSGRVSGLHRFLGLFTSKAQVEEAAHVPLLRRSLRLILAAEQVVAGGHDWKAIVGVFNAIPKGELFAATAAEIRADVRAVLDAAARRGLVVTVSARAGGRRLSVLASLPADDLEGRTPDRIAALVHACYGGAPLLEHVRVGDDGMAHVHLAFAPARPPDEAERAALRDAIEALFGSWEEALREALVARVGAGEGVRLAAAWAGAFTVDYRAGTGIARAVDDTLVLERVRAGAGPEIALDTEPDGGVALRLYVAGTPLVLSDMLPMLEHHGLRVLNEDRVTVARPDGPPCYVHRLLVTARDGGALDVAAVAERLRAAVLAVLAGRTRSGVLSRLVVEGGLDWRAVDVLRGYAGYVAQLGVGTRPEVAEALAERAPVSAALWALVVARLRDGGDPAPARAAVLAAIDAVPVLRQDRLLRTVLAAVEATVRTNVFARGGDDDRVVLKLCTAELTFLPPPQPRVEIYVRDRTVEGLHLRAGLVARGGLRLSDRPEDFRQEALGLMRTQTVKNAVIVPTGAKGAFVPRDGAPAADAHRDFVAGLLDVTDDVADGQVVRPRGVRVLDGDDPYLVVAADKGTATFSDAANALATARGFWLGDAFASGGSHGYDHKALGITARGAWECVRTHFRGLGIDADTAPLAVVGIGDMGGDVFGNGLLRSPHLRLLAAFNHRHVFLDPDPDPARSFAERQRLFRAGRGWDAYDPAVLSAGGMVVERAAKRVRLSPEARAMLELAETPSGEALVRAVLRMPADLLWNGGIGTYVRAADESDAAVGDPTNDAVRITAEALRVRVVAEGGNLGLTQRARVAFALAGGAVNTDAIDNSAGVDTSDHEVNLKICLQPVVASGAMPEGERHALLKAVQDDVARHVLAHNRRQSWLLTVEQARSRERLGDFRDHAAALAREADVAGVLEVLPDAAILRARRAAHPGLLRPELALLMAHTKIALQHALRDAALLDDPIGVAWLADYFPAALRERAPEAVAGHRLRRELVAVELVNALVDYTGMTFVHRLRRDTGADAVAAVRAWAIAWVLADAATLVADLEAAPLAVDEAVRGAVELEAALEGAAGWVLTYADPRASAAAVAAGLAADVAPVLDALSQQLAGGEAEAFHRRRSGLELAGAGPQAARRLAGLAWLPAALDVAGAARDTGLPVDEAAARYWALGAHVDFAWLLGQVAATAEGDRWAARAARELALDLLGARRRLVYAAPAALAGPRLDALRSLVRDLRTTPRPTLAALLVVAREIRRLAESLPFTHARPGTSAW